MDTNTRLNQLCSDLVVTDGSLVACWVAIPIHNRPMSVALIAALALSSLTLQLVLGEQFIDPRSYLRPQVWFGATPEAFPRQLRRGSKQWRSPLSQLLIVIIMV